MKLLFPASRLGPPTFADYRSFGDESSGPLPLVAYVGGAIPEAEYEARRESEPTELLAAFSGSYCRHGRPFGALVIPCPPIVTPDRELLRRLVLGHFACELVPALPVRVTTLAFVGFSFGAFLATMLAAEHAARARGLATLAGVGMAEGWTLAGSPTGGSFPPVRCYTNAADPCSWYTLDFETKLRQVGSAITVVRRPGGHSFGDYLSNGAVRDALDFAVGMG